MYRFGTLLHEELGDIEVECPNCHGEGDLEVELWDRPWHLRRVTCETCHGSGEVWKIPEKTP